MRQPPLLRWIEQAEARRAAAAFYERASIAALQRDSEKRTPSAHQPRGLRPLLRRWRPFRVADRPG